MKQALSGTANANNASFVHLMKRHQQLLEKGKILTDSMMKELGIELNNTVKTQEGGKSTRTR
ncbi:TPA: hypothetical protein ACMDR6_003047 [Vibrio parahaemolyticus]